MADLNYTVQQGRLTRDVELKYTPNGKALAKGTIANTTGFGDNERTHFISFTMWGARAEGISKYLTKGKQIIVWGELHCNEWETDEGQKRKDWFINFASVHFCSGDPKPKDGIPF